MNTSISQLRGLIENVETPMHQYCAACRALAQMQTGEAYTLLRELALHGEKNRQRIALAEVFAYEEALELAGELERILRETTEAYLLWNVLGILEKYPVPVSESLLLYRLRRDRSKLSSGHYRLLRRLSRTEENYREMVRLFHAAKENGGIRREIALQLAERAEPAQGEELLALFSCDEQPGVRMCAVRLAVQLGRREVLESFLRDRDGHVRRLAESCLR